MFSLLKSSTKLVTRCSFYFFIDGQTFCRGQITESTITNTTKNQQIFVYSKNDSAKYKLIKTLRNILDSERYVIGSLGKDTLTSGVWRERTGLIAIEGNVEDYDGCLLIDYFLEGGKIFAWNSDLITKVFPKYDLNNQEEMNMHLKENFPKNQLDIAAITMKGKDYTSTLMKLVDFHKNGIVVLYAKESLDKSDCDQDQDLPAMVEGLIRDIGYYLREIRDDDILTPAYFLGNNDQKIALVNDVTNKLDSDKKKIQRIGDLTLQWCVTKEIVEEKPTDTFLPVYLHDFPETFSYKNYFGNLKSKSIGRLLIYSEILKSTMDIAKGSLGHGVAVVARKQLQSVGRGIWKTPGGQTAITVQVIQKASPTLCLVQHAAALAIVSAIKQGEHEDLNIGIRWPNEVCYGQDIIIGGTMTAAKSTGKDVVLNIGTGVNISNSETRISLNMIIQLHNQMYDTNLPLISIETFLSRYCSELEKYLDILAADKGAENLLTQYHKYWLHCGQKVAVKINEDKTVKGVISGLDSAGLILVKVQGL